MTPVHNDILHRFSRVQSRLRGRFTTLEAIRSGRQIVFRTGLGCAIILAGLSMGVVLWVSLVFTTNFFEYPPGMTARVAIALMMVVMLIMAFSFVREGRVHFIIDADKEKILIPNSQGGFRRISLERVEFFLGCRISGSESIQSVVYAVSAEGAQYRLTDELGPGSRLPAMIGYLGFICDRPALLMATDEVEGLPKQKEQLLRAAQVVYRPGQTDGLAD